MGMVLFIFFINVVYVSALTIRMMLTLKGQKYQAALISILEVTVFVVGLGLVLDRLDQIQNLLAYALGFATGILIGSKIEEKLALGYVTVKVVSRYYRHPFPQLIRKQGYGVTSWIGEGRDGKRLVMEILVSRKDQESLYNHLVAFDPSAFIISYEPRHFRGGFWVSSLKRYAKQRNISVDFPEEEVLPGVDQEIIEEIQSSKDYNSFQKGKMRPDQDGDTDGDS